MKTYTPIIDSQRIVFDNEWKLVSRDNITEEVIFKKRDLHSIIECDCCFNLIYTFKINDEYWQFERPNLSCVADFKSNYAETRPAQPTLN